MNRAVRWSLAMVALSGCTKRNPAYCEIAERDCPGGYCDDNHLCVLLDAAFDAAADAEVPCALELTWAGNGPAGPYDIFIAFPDGAGQRPLVQNPVQEVWPLWSPMRDRFAYLRPSDANPTGPSSLWLANADGSVSQPVTSGSDTMPSWSPDGSELAFVRDTGGTGDIWVVNPDSGQTRNLSVGSIASELAPSWSTVGDRIAFLASSGSATNVRTMAPDGSDRRNVTNDAADNNGNTEAPQWNPGGTSVAFMSDRSGDMEIWAADYDGGNLRNLTNSPGTDDYYPRWVSDAELLFVRIPVGGGPNTLWSMNDDGTGQAEIPIFAALDAGSGQLGVSADGSRLAWTSVRDGNYEIYSANTDGTDVVRVTTNPGGDGYPTFRNCP